MADEYQKATTAEDKQRVRERKRESDGTLCQQKRLDLAASGLNKWLHSPLAYLKKKTIN